MSWPQWQPPAQPTMPMMNSAMPMGIQYSAEQWQQMQQQNWQQWAQWQQQYQQWHQQYGAEYQKSLTAMANMGTIGTPAPPTNTAVRPPLPNDAKPPLPPDEPMQTQPHQPPIPNKQKPPPSTNKTAFQSQTTTKPPYGYNTNADNNVNTWVPPPTNQTQNRQNDFHPQHQQHPQHPQHPQRQHQGKRQALEHHPEVGSSKKNKLDWQPPPPNTQTKPKPNHTQATLAALDNKQFGPQLPAPAPPTQQQQQEENKEDLSDPEKKFMKQFAEWEAQFNKWKEQNQDHPDKTQYREYEKKWEAWRNQLLERRELMRKKRLGLIPANVNINTSLEMTSTNISINANTTVKSSADISSLNSGNISSTDTADLINPINSKVLATLFKNNLNDGIPGLDLVDAPGQPDDIPAHEKGKFKDPKPETTEAKPGLNLEALSKNLNSILGDQKLLSMLSLVAQSTNTAPPVKPDVSQGNTTPSGITLAPAKVMLDDQTSNWSTNTNNTNNSGNSTPWSQDFASNAQGRDFPPNKDKLLDQGQGQGQGHNNRFGGNQGNNFGNNSNEMQGNYSRDSQSGSFDSRQGMGSGQGHGNYPMNDRDREFQGPNRFDDFDRNDKSDGNEGRFIPNNHQQNSFEDSYWSPNDQNGPQDEPKDIMAPAPPTIASFDELLHIDPDKIIDYDHKNKKQDTTDVRVFTPRLFDYRHKLVSRIPLSDRPKWLSDTYHNIPEFGPPISRNAAPFSRHAAPYPTGGPPGPPPGSHYNDGNAFMRRPLPPMSGPSNAPNDYEKLGRPDDDFRRRNNSNPNNSNSNKDDYEQFKRQKFVGKDGRVNEQRADRDYDRDRNRDNNRDRRDNMRDRNNDRGKDFNFNRNRDGKRDAKDSPGPASGSGSGSGSGNGNLKKDIFDTSNPVKNILSFAQNQQLFSAALKIDENRISQVVRTNIDDILNMPARAKRPQRIVIILRGPPGSGKTSLAKQIKDKETENGGSAPRILSLDDYFMVEQEKEVIEDGKTVKIKDMVYEYEECMEESYRQSLLKTFKKTITDGYFPFIIVDNINDKVKYFDSMWSFAKQNGFQVYICQLDLDVQICTKRNTHGRSEVEIQHIVNGWEEVPSHYGILDATNLIQAGSIAEVEMEEIDSPNEDFDDDDDNDNEEQACNSSKWDNFECSIDNLAKLDGINKPLRSAGTMEDYLQLDEWTVNRSETKPGQKRVRWADLEERKEQDKMRAIGFVVGQTDWGRMMDPTQGGSALTQTMYIERVGVRKVNTN